MNGGEAAQRRHGQSHSGPHSWDLPREGQGSLSLFPCSLQSTCSFFMDSSDKKVLNFFFASPFSLLCSIFCSTKPECSKRYHLALNALLDSYPSLTFLTEVQNLRKVQFFFVFGTPLPRRAQKPHRKDHRVVLSLRNMKKVSKYKPLRMISLSECCGYLKLSGSITPCPSFALVFPACPVRTPSSSPAVLSLAQLPSSQAQVAHSIIQSCLQMELHRA